MGTVAIIAGILLGVILVVIPLVLYTRTSGENHAIRAAADLEHPRDLLEG